MTTTSTTYFCPRCGSPALDIAAGALALDDAPAACQGCGWTGPKASLLTNRVRHNAGSDDQLIDTWSRQLRDIFARHMGEPLAKFLGRWGFVDATDPNATRVFARYLAAIGLATAKAVVETRRQLAIEAAGQEAPVIDQDPYIEAPDQVKPTGDELFCYRDQARPCTPACVAYLGFGNEPKGDFPGAIARCSLLVDSHRTGKHLVILAQQVTAEVKRNEVAAFDRRAGR